MAFNQTHYRSLGATGPSVSPLGLGTVKFGRNRGVKYPAAFDLPTDRDIEILLDSARSFGINLLDTAPAYGTSEQRLGQLLRAREEWILCSKAGEGAAGEYNFSTSALQLSVEKSLQALRTDYLDVLLIHSDGNDLQNLNDETLAVLQSLKSSGKVRLTGASTKTVAGGLLAAAELDIVMVEYRPDDLSQQPVLESARQGGKGVLVKKALASGHATNRRDNLATILEQSAVSSIIVGTLSSEHLRENVKAAL